MRFNKLWYALPVILLLICSTFALAEGEFTGKAVVTNDQHYYSKWSNLIGIYIPPICSVSKVYPGEIVDIRLMVSRMPLNEAKEADITADIEIFDPSGKSYFSLEKVKVIKQIIFADLTYVSDFYQRVRFAETDKLGKYHVKVTFNDNITKQKLVSEADIELVQYGTDKANLTDQQLEKLLWSYYQAPNSHIIMDFFRIVQKYINQEGADFGKVFASMFRSFFKDNDYLVPHLIEYLKGLEPAARKNLFPVIKGITIDYPTMVDKLALTAEEKAALDATEYVIISDNTFANPLEIDMLALNFVATGRMEPITILVRAIPLWIDQDPAKVKIGETAVYSLLNNSKNHPTFRSYLIATLSRDIALDQFTKDVVNKIIQDTETK